MGGGTSRPRDSLSTPARVVDSPAAAAGAVLETASQFFAFWTVALRPESGILCQGWTPPEAGDGYVRGLVHGAFVVEMGDDARSSAGASTGVRQRVVDGVVVNLAPVFSLELDTPGSGDITLRTVCLLGG